jgi:hypothetical protein
MYDRRPTIPPRYPLHRQRRCPGRATAVPDGRVPSSARPAPARFRSRPLLAAGCLSLWAGICAGQWGGFGWGGGGWGNYASTAQQGAAYGMAQMMRAQGYQNLQNSEAAKNWEQATTMEMQNRLQWTETYFEMRKVNREARAAEAPPPVTHERAIRLAKMAAPRRLASTELDPVTGQIDYPLVLQDDVFRPYRERLDALFAHRAKTGGSIQFEDYQLIQGTVAEFIEALKSRVGDYAAGEYGRARTFLNSLAHETRFPAG